LSNVNGIGSSQPFSSIEQSLASTAAGRLARADGGKSSITQEANQSGAAETTNLSATAGVLTSALSSSDVRIGLVTQLQQSIGAGSYNVTASDVASKMMSSLFN
jgi:flagellar biosynthesis anti-sigma factor FlgM